MSRPIVRSVPEAALCLIVGLITAGLVLGTVASRPGMEWFFHCHTPNPTPVPCPSIVYSDGSPCTANPGQGPAVFKYCRITWCPMCFSFCTCSGIDNTDAPCCTMSTCF